MRQAGSKGKVNPGGLRLIFSQWKFLFWLFIVSSVIGWIYEVLVYRFELGYGFVNRGFLFGPWLPVYGFGGLFIIAGTAGLRNRECKIGRVDITPVICFLAVMLIASILELATSYVMDAFMGGCQWDYSAKFL